MKLQYIALTFCFLLLSSCSENIPPVESSYDSKILYLGNGTEPKDLDPHTVTGVPESKILMALIEGLVIRHPDGLEPLPGIAKSWDISLDGKEYIFNIRDAVWSNGDPVTADDFVYAWKRMLMPSLGSKYPDMLYDVVNAEEFNKGLIDDFNLVGVKAIDNKTLVVNLKNPAPYFIELLAHYTTRPVHQGTIEKYGEIDRVKFAANAKGIGIYDFIPINPYIKQNPPFIGFSLLDSKKASSLDCFIFDSKGQVDREIYKFNERI